MTLFGRGRGHDHHHGHQHDRGVGGFLRYLRLVPAMWRSAVSDEVVRSIAPAPGEHVLDLGAGMGAATVKAARNAAAVMAVDPASYMRRILRLRRLWQSRRAAITVMDGAAESIPTPDGSVDALWTVNTIHHWTDRAAAARELARVMRPGGRLLLVDEDFENPSHPEHARTKAHRARSRHPFESVEVEVLAAALLDAGFARAEGAEASIAGRPAKVIRGTR